ncbi:MAG: VOC family protein [Hyphomicrobiaceae bacterium]|nr:VOC family protein [Hyphomicrobiaceae bacterium]
MQLGSLDHVNVRTSRLEAMVEWYGRVLGMPSGERPPFPFPGAWLYVGDQPYVHLIGTDKEPGAHPDDLKIEHFAFSAQGLSEFTKKLDEAGERYEKRVVPGFGITQVNVWDPDGNHIHIDFAPGDA